MTREEFCDFLKTAEYGRIIKCKVSGQQFIFDGMANFVGVENKYNLDDIITNLDVFAIVKMPRKKEFMLNLSKENCDSIFIDIDDFKLLNYMSHACLYSPDIEQDSMKIKITVEEVFG